MDSCWNTSDKWKLLEHPKQLNYWNTRMSCSHFSCRRGHSQGSTTPPRIRRCMKVFTAFCCCPPMVKYSWQKAWNPTILELLDKLHITRAIVSSSKSSTASWKKHKLTKLILGKSRKIFFQRWAPHNIYKIFNLYMYFFPHLPGEGC